MCRLQWERPSAACEEKPPRQALVVLSGAEEILGEQTAGAYLYGSAVLGGLRPNSDIDLLLLIRGELSAPAREELTRLLLRESDPVGCAEKRPLEVTVVQQKDLTPWRFPPVCAYLYGEWLRQEIEAGRLPQPFHSPDLAILLWQARGRSLTLLGEPAETLIPPIGSGEVRRAIRHSLPELRGNLQGDERNVLLTLARMWFTLETGGICPKDAAAAWALPKLPQPLVPLLETAGLAYLGQAEDSWEAAQEEAAALADFMAQRIAELLRQNSEP